jgi:hypothetical protein
VRSPRALAATASSAHDGWFRKESRIADIAPALGLRFNHFDNLVIDNYQPFFRRCLLVNFQILLGLELRTQTTQHCGGALDFRYGTALFG